MLNLKCLVAVYSNKFAQRTRQILRWCGCRRKQLKKCRQWWGGNRARSCEIVAVNGGSIFLGFIREKWLGSTPWLSAAPCSATASHTGLRSTPALRAVTIQLTSLPSVARRALRAAPVIMGR